MTHDSAGCERLRARLRLLQGRLATRAWEARQRHCAKGAWPRLCRALADASRAYAVSEAELDELLAEGHALEAAGADLEPCKRVVFISAKRAQNLRTGRALLLRLSTEIVSARALALVRFA